MLVGGGGATWEGLEWDSADLTAELHGRIADHDGVSYDDLWTAFGRTDRREDGRIWDIYSDPGVEEAAYLYDFETDQCGEYDSEGDCYNREHTFPQSWSDDIAPMKTDLHQVFPVDGWVNGLRGSLPYAEVRESGSETSNGSRRGLSAICGYEDEGFEPVDAYQGDLARAQLYMAVRYRGEDGGWASSEASQGASLEPWYEQMLIAWHLLDPVSEKERARNDAVESLQGNRNPFVDRPEFVCGITDF